MAVITDFIATSAEKKEINIGDFSTFLSTLLHEFHFPLPAAILVGEAKNTTPNTYWFGANENYITPNSPGNMLEVKEADFPQELIWYYGDNETKFFEALRTMPVGKEDCCISFPVPPGKLIAQREGRKEYEDTRIDGWDGAVIYLLKQPMMLDWPDEAIWKGNTTFDRSVQHFFCFHSVSGGGGISMPLQSLLTSYFGPDLVMGTVLLFW